MQSCPRCSNRFPDAVTTCLFDGATLERLSDPRLGTTIAGRYVLEDLIGEGGMAKVYRARHKLASSIFAIKIMNPLFARDAIVRERFRREASSAKKISHPNIIEIFEEGDTEGTAYMVMEHLSGAALADLVSAGAMDMKRAVPLMIQMARGIARAHDLGVIHRDLKPENIFIVSSPNAEESVKLLDFGIALSRQDPRLTGSGELFGTPQYMAPERITTTEAGPAADLYSLGIIFFEMLTGHLPFEAPDIASFFIRHLKDTPAPIREHARGVSERLAALIDSLLAKDAKQRPVDAHQVTKELILVAHEIGARVPPEPDAESESLRGQSVPIATHVVERWSRRTLLFKEMLMTIYGQSPPVEQSFLIDQLEELAARVSLVKNRSVEEQRKVEDLLRKGREVRMRLGLAVEALGVDASQARAELRPLEEELLRTKNEEEIIPTKLPSAIKEITVWEGRSGLREPMKQLEKAYRDAADLVATWREHRRATVAAEEAVSAKKQVLRDLEFQIAQLRESLVKHEAAIDAALAESERDALAMSQEVDDKESDLLALATTFCAPLRNKPELTPLFAQLEAA